ncbi:hypothetical protein MANY_53760 [Mycolicibacterium anyangense]|uniref:Uncharacterized protein n=1 Tax=Mycolicibacterium anyangense TaxID=1431246 RepID=A0A6N4WG59_9MYCO|nr:hypothetical protein [Mycolicibacterium anyangense]BBZ80039.1 hypothetical protein MANY_53760 [Mycolicibacterium anyangense]
MDTPERPKEAELIERRRLEQSPRLSVTRAAKLAGISEGRWRQIAKGYQQATKDTRIPVIAPPDTLARMADVVGSSPQELREAGRDDAADDLERLQSDDVPPADTRGGMAGVRAVMRRSQIMRKPEKDRSDEEVEWLSVYDAAHPRRLDPNIVSAGEIRPSDAIFDDWLAARNRMLNLVLEYAATRRISFQLAENELSQVQQMATDVQLGTGRPWTPPWNPGPEFEPGDEPWRAEWWSTWRHVPSSEAFPGTLGVISESGAGQYDVSAVKAFRQAVAAGEAPWRVGPEAGLNTVDIEAVWRPAQAMVYEGDLELTTWLRNRGASKQLSKYQDEVAAIGEDIASREGVKRFAKLALGTALINDRLHAVHVQMERNASGEAAEVLIEAEVALDLANISTEKFGPGRSGGDKPPPVGPRNNLTDVRPWRPHGPQRAG